MKLKEFLANINKLVAENPEVLDFDVIAAIDDEGNGFNRVNYPPSVGSFDGNEKEFDSESQINNPENGYEVENYPINAVCIN